MPSSRGLDYSAANLHAVCIAELMIKYTEKFLEKSEGWKKVSFFSLYSVRKKSSVALL